MKNRLQRTAPVILVLLFLSMLFLPVMTEAGTKSVYWERMDVTLEVMKNGDVEVVETQQIHFQGGPFHHGYREFSTSSVVGVSDISITDDEGRKYSQSSGEQPYTFKVSRTEGKIRIDWYFPPDSDFTKTWKISYVLHGALYFYTHSNTLQWTAIFAKRAGVVKEAKVTVILPKGVTPLKALPYSKYHNVKVTSSQGNIVVFEATKELPPDDYIGVLVSWKSGFIKGTPAPWQLKHDRWQHVFKYASNIKISKNGDLHVTEYMDLYLSGGPYTYFSRKIPMNRIASISMVSVRIDGKDYTLENNSGDSHPAYSFTAKRKGNDFEIKAYFPPTSYSSHELTISYIAHGAIWYGKKLDSLKWQASPNLSGTRGVGIDSAVVTVSFPPEVNLQDFSVNLANARVDHPNGHTVRITTGKIIPGTVLKFDARWPHGEISGSPSPWQIEEEKAQRRKQREAIVKAVIPFLSMLMAVAGSLLAYLLWLLKGKEPKVSLPADYLNEPPEDAPPAMVGELTHYSITGDELFGSILKLAQEGFLKIKDEAGDFKLTRLKDPKEAKSDLERMLMELMFRDMEPGKLKKLSSGWLSWLQKKDLNEVYRDFFSGELLHERLMSEIVTNFGHYQKIVTSLATRQAIDKGYFKGDPYSTRKKFSSIGSSMAIVGILLLLFGRGLFPGIWTLYLTLIVIGGTLMIVSAKWNALTPKGADVKARWQAFKRYLEEIEMYTDLESSKNLFEKYLPYAVGFGFKKEFVNKFQLLGTPAPDWWDTETPFVTSDSDTFPQTEEMPEGGHVHEAPLPSAGNALDEASSGALGGLDSMSDKLFSLFDTATSPAESPGYSGGGASDYGGSDWDSDDDFDWDSDDDFDFDDDSSGGFD